MAITPFIVEAFTGDAVPEDSAGKMLNPVVEFFKRGGIVVPGFVVALPQVHGVCVHEVGGDLVFCFGEQGWVPFVSRAGLLVGESWVV